VSSLCSLLVLLPHLDGLVRLTGNETGATARGMKAVLCTRTFCVHVRFVYMCVWLYKNKYACLCMHMSYVCVWLCVFVCLLNKLAEEAAKKVAGIHNVRLSVMFYDHS
jgi:hypothetical protein